VTQLRCILQRYYVFPLPERRIAELVKWADIVHLIGHWTLLNAAVYRQASRAGKPYVLCPAGALPIFGRSPILKAIYNKMIGVRIVREASACIAITDKERPDLHAYGVDDDKIFKIPNGIDPEEFEAADPASFRRQFGLRDDPLILYVGRLHELKGPDLLLRAFIDARDKLKDHHLVFAGPDGGELQKLTSITAEANLTARVHFLGYISPKSKIDAYAAASLVAIPSRREAMSLVVLEAGICGTPVLISDQCGFDQIEEIGGGKVVSATAEGLREGLVALLTGPGRLHEMGARLAAFTRQNFLWESVVQRYKRLFEQLLACGGKSMP
jgi:glycosyltransferase involved in cell wall biosynthesis